MSVGHLKRWSVSFSYCATRKCWPNLFSLQLPPPLVWAALPPHHNIHLDAFLHAGGLSDGVHGCVLPHTGAFKHEPIKKQPVASEPLAFWRLPSGDWSELKRPDITSLAGEASWGRPSSKQEGRGRTCPTTSNSSPLTLQSEPGLIKHPTAGCVGGREINN